MELLVLAGLFLQSATIPQCSPGAGFHGAAPGESIAVATATGRTEWVSTSSAPLLSATSLLDPNAQVLGYELVIDQATPSTPMRLGTWGILVPRDTVIAVPWTLNSNCEVTPIRSEEWVPAGHEVVIRVDAVRLDGGRRVVDIFGPMNGFPYSTHTPPELQTPIDRSTWLSASDFFRILLSAPRPGSEQGPEAQLRTLENAYRGGPMYLLDRFPGPQMLEWARTWARTGNDRVPPIPERAEIA